MSVSSPVQPEQPSTPIPHRVHEDVQALFVGPLFVALGVVLFRHRASLGGFNVLVLYLQERFGWRAGKVQMAMDCAIVLAAFGVVDLERIAWSVVGAVALNLTPAINHRPGRYMAV